MRSTQRFTSLLSFAIAVVIAQPAWTKVEFDSNQLLMKNADQISEIVRNKIKRAQAIQSKQEDTGDTFVAEPAALEELKSALRIVLARPDQDGTRANAFSRLRRELIDLQSLEEVLQDLASEGIAGIKSGTNPQRISTYIVMLENLMAELKPEVGTNAEFKKIIETIRDANLTVADKVKNQQRLRAMSKPVSPSETAAKIVPRRDPK